MNISDFPSGMMHIEDHNAPRREIELNPKEEFLVTEAIRLLEKSNIDTNNLFKIFDDWQTKRTLTTKRLFVSTSVLVSAATWIGIDYTNISIIGLNVSSGSPFKFVVFILLIIILSGIFYEVSRRIDMTVKNAKISKLNEDLKGLKEIVNKTTDIMKKRNIVSFSALFYDFQPRSQLGGVTTPPTGVFNAVQFYYKHLSTANSSQKTIALFELIVIYSLGLFSVGALLFTLMKIYIKA